MSRPLSLATFRGILQAGRAPSELRERSRSRIWKNLRQQPPPSYVTSSMLAAWQRHLVRFYEHQCFLEHTFFSSLKSPPVCGGPGHIFFFFFFPDKASWVSLSVSWAMVVPSSPRFYSGVSTVCSLPRGQRAFL